MAELFGHDGLTARFAGELVGASLLDGVRLAPLEQRPGVRVLGAAGKTPATWSADFEAVLLLGAFDGLHEGHRALADGARSDARSRGALCLAVTFDPDPSELVGYQGEQPRLLSVEDRVRALLVSGADAVAVIDFTEALARLEPVAFVDDVLMPLARVASIHVGEDFRFGCGGAGDADLLAELGAQRAFAVRRCPLVRRAGEPVSASRIREALQSPGALDVASRLLGRWHFVRGVVEHGRGEGTSFGFPTANVRVAAGSCLPAQGVYGGYVCLEGLGTWPAAINVGAPVSFSGPDELLCEANLIGFAGDAYGMPAAVVFAHWLRPARRFDSLEELEATVLANIDWVREHLPAPDPGTSR